jgi:hypothetical protein
VQFETAYIARPKTVVVRLHGAGPASAIHQLVAAVQASPKFRRGMAVLIDGLDADFLPAEREAETFPGVFGAALAGSRVAIIPKPGVPHRLWRMVGKLAELRGVPFAVFPSEDYAMRWLHLRPAATVAAPVKQRPSDASQRGKAKRKADRTGTRRERKER